jgi:transposase-like protein
MPRQYSVQFRDRVLGLVEQGRDVGELASELASELGISSATIYRWRQQARVDAGEFAGVNSAVAAELADARRRIRELEEELAATQFAATMLRDESIRPKGGSRSLRP